MSKVRLLPDQVANQIAAGEVVERPASVVKELVENSLDAGATRIEVEIQSGGRSLIRVTDDGSGMDRDDALLSVERHATSKITSAHDLAKIGSFGFRGEALPSIASVSQFTLTTRTVESETATQVIVNGGKIDRVGEAGHPQGTTIEVRQIFFNVPARRKFLRTIETERSHVHHYLTLVAMAHPDVALTYVQDRRQVMHLPAVPSRANGASQFKALGERWRSLPGMEPNTIPLDHEGMLPPRANLDNGDAFAEVPVRVWGLIGAPGVSRGSRQDVYFFVNHRPVTNRALDLGLREGFHTLIAKGRHPICCLFVEIDPAEVDVNIHPAKREVKFHRDRAIREVVCEAVRQALRDFQSDGDPEELVTDDAIPQPVNAANVLTVETQPELPSSTHPEAKPSDEADASQSKPPSYESFTRDLPDAPKSPTPTRQTPPPAQPNAPVPLLKVPLRLVGVIARTYVVYESDRGMVLMDQRAAHERVLYERLLRHLDEHDAPSQRLLLPITLELTSRDAQFLAKNLDALRKMGIGVSEFGDKTFLLDGLPPFASGQDGREFILDLIDELKEVGQGHVRALDVKEIAKTVSHKSVRTNQTLTDAELDRLLNDLRRCDMPYTAPSGRPTLIEMSTRDLQRRFGAID